MKVTDLEIVAGAAVVAIAAVLGGAFHPGPRVVVGVLVAAVICISAMKWREAIAQEEWLVLIFVGWGVCCAVVCGGAPLAAREVLAGWVAAWCLWAIARRASDIAAKMGAGVLLAGALILVLGIVLETAGLGGIRVGGLLENPNVAAALLVVTLPLAISLNSNGGWWRRTLVVVPLIVGVALSGSRAGLLALVVVAAAALPRGKVRVMGLAVGAAGTAGVLIWRFMSQPDLFAWFRPAIWSGILRLWASHPVFGVGPGGLVDAAGPVRLLHADHVGHRQFLISYAESSPLAVIVQTGAVGFLIAGAALVLWMARSRARGVLDSTGLRSGLLAMVVMAAFHDFLNVDVVLWWWAVVLGLLEASFERVSIRSATALSPTTRIVCAAILSFIVLWGVVQPSWARWLWQGNVRDEQLVERTVRAEPWFDEPLEWRVRNLLHRQEWGWEVAGEALARSRQAVKVHPGAARLWTVQGIVMSRIINDFGPWPEAVEEGRSAFARAVDLEPYQPWALLEWARLERGLGNLDQSVDLVHKALEAEPNAVRARLFLARLELDRAQLEEAREAYEAARASVRMRSSAGLNAYERELLAAPEWQMRELEEGLR